MSPLRKEIPAIHGEDPFAETVMDYTGNPVTDPAMSMYKWLGRTIMGNPTDPQQQKANWESGMLDMVSPINVGLRMATPGQYWSKRMAEWFPKLYQHLDELRYPIATTSNVNKKSSDFGAFMPYEIGEAISSDVPPYVTGQRVPEKVGILNMRDPTRYPSEDAAAVTLAHEGLHGLFNSMYAGSGMPRGYPKQYEAMWTKLGYNYPEVANEIDRIYGNKFPVDKRHGIVDIMAQNMTRKAGFRPSTMANEIISPELRVEYALAPPIQVPRTYDVDKPLPPKVLSQLWDSIPAHQYTTRLNFALNSGEPISLRDLNSFLTKKDFTKLAKLSPELYFRVGDRRVLSLRQIVDTDWLRK